MSSYYTLILVALFLIPVSLLCAQESAESNAPELNTLLAVPEFIDGLQFGLLAAIVWDGTTGSNEWNSVYDYFDVFLEFEEEGVFGLAFSAGITNQNKTARTTNDILAVALTGHWFEVNEGIIYLDFGSVYLHGGININDDIVNTPYSLFLSSNKNAALNANISYVDEVFSFKSLWLGLNGPTSVIADYSRGANYREYAVNLDAVGIRFGYQESVVYFDEFLNPVYFFVPFPLNILELIYGATLNPNNTSPDSNTQFGLFFEYSKDRLYALTQVLVDDITPVNGVLKAAWSIGARYEFDFGTLGFFHAGATKHTFASSYLEEGSSDKSYRAYTYFPTNVYGDSTASRTLWYFDNYIGYKYGENNIAFLIDYQNRFGIVDVASELEYVISGAKSPIIPWHGEDIGAQQTALLTDDILEHTLKLSVALDISILTDLKVVFSGAIGVIVNELALSDNSVFTPTPGSRLLHYLYVGVQYGFNHHESQWRRDGRIPQYREL